MVLLVEKQLSYTLRRSKAVTTLHLHSIYCMVLGRAVVWRLGCWFGWFGFFFPNPVIEEVDAVN